MIVLGTVGHGKSNFLNRLAGKTIFKSKRDVESVTQFPELTITDDFNIIDTPGLNDSRIETKDWVERFNNSGNAACP